MGQTDASSEKTGKGLPRRAEVLFLGHNSKHHDSGKYAPWLAISLFKEGINLTYTTQLQDLNTETLNKYDGLIIYANHDNLAPEQEQALQQFVESGKGLIPLHSASGSFKNSQWYINALGGQFKSHGTGTFSPVIAKKNHPVTQGLPAFSTWDETYVHQNLNKDMTVLMERVEGSTREPYTWVRNQGKGRVFYTAYGHNDSTWINPGFLQLVNQGVLWALGDQVKKQIAGLNIPKVDIYASAGINIADFTKRYEVPAMQTALTAAESQKLIQAPVDFELQLFAAEPDIINPINMSWDEKGRLWIVESVDYPNTFIETDGLANDRIKICEDTNGDGKADKFTIFADKLNIPTSLVFANGGVIVSMAPHFVFLKDTNGDDKADVRENIITGWGKNDTHAGPSNLLYGFDNKIWGVLGYSGFNGTVGGKNMSFGQGLYRFTPDGKELEYLASSSNNTWGLGFSEDNNIFISTANNTHSAFYSMPARYMQRMLPALSAQAGESTTGARAASPSAVQSIQKLDGHYDVHALTPNLRQVDVVGGFTAAAGHHLYTARNFPKEYWNRIAFVTEPTVRLVHNAIIEPNGAGFTEKDGWNLLASSDEWFGPVQAQVGPDGAVWVADWYNFIIQHNVFVPAQAPSRMILPFTEQPHGQGNAFKSPLRDINFGRIYRVVYKKAKPYTP
ncbi:MAG: rane-bound dehydrogenase domain protein, partial [Adhaeribacter sp.]|nr:rane-bound dehydrogenase domain protein [Adhaeribacter sp.]